MNILFVSSGNKKSEISPIVFKQGESIRKLKYDLDYFSIKGKGVKGYISNIIPLRKKINDKKYDVIHVHFGLSTIVGYLSQCFRIKKIPIVVSLMGSDILDNNKKTTIIKIVNSFAFWIIKNKSSHIIVKSNEMFNKINIPAKTSIIPNGVDFNLFKPLDKKELQDELGWDKNVKHVLFAADPNRKVKNYELAKKSVLKIKRFKIEIHHLINESHNNIVKLMNASDIVILSSLFEGSPNVIKEAMACNKPIVSTNVGDVSSIMANTIGCFVTDNTINEFSSKIEYTLENHSVTNGRDQISYLKEGKIAEKIIGIYKNILNEK